MEKRRLGDIATYINGYAFKPTDWSRRGLPIIRIQDLTGTSYQLNYYDGRYPERIEINNGDILISWSASLGVYVWNKGKALLNQHIFKVEFNKIQIDKQYFVYAVKYSLAAMISKMHGATMKHIVKKDFDNIKVSYPDIKEQGRIVDILLNVENVIEARKQQLEQLDALARARFVEMFGDTVFNTKSWDMFNLDEMANIVSGITKGRKTRNEILTEVPYMAVSNVKDGYIDWTTVKTILATRSEIEQYRLLPSDILMTEGGDPDKVGRGAIIHQPLKNCIHQNHIFRVRLNTDKVLPAYFSEYLKNPKAKQYFLGCAKQTTGIASINMMQIKALPVITPPMNIQKKYTAFVAQTDKSKFLFYI